METLDLLSVFSAYEKHDLATEPIEGLVITSDNFR